MKSATDTRAPMPQPHLTLYGRDYVAKKRATTEAAFSDLKMIQTIARTMTRRAELPTRHGPVSLNAGARKNEIYSIMQENHRLLNSLEKLGPTVSTSAMIKSDVVRQRYIINSSHSKRLSGEYDDDIMRIHTEDKIKFDTMRASAEFRRSKNNGSQSLPSLLPALAQTAPGALEGLPPIVEGAKQGPNHQQLGQPGSKASSKDVRTTMTKDAYAGDTEIQTMDTTGFAIGDRIVIGGGSASEENAIVGFGSIILASPLEKSFPAGTAVAKMRSSSKSSKGGTGGGSSASSSRQPKPAAAGSAAAAVQKAAESCRKQSDTVEVTLDIEAARGDLILHVLSEDGLEEGQTYKINAGGRNVELIFTVSVDVVGSSSAICLAEPLQDMHLAGERMVLQAKVGSKSAARIDPSLDSPASSKAIPATPHRGNMSLPGDEDEDMVLVDDQVAGGHGKSSPPANDGATAKSSPPVDDVTEASGSFESASTGQPKVAVQEETNASVDGLEDASTKAVDQRTTPASGLEDSYGGESGFASESGMSGTNLSASRTGPAPGGGGAAPPRNDTFEDSGSYEESGTAGAGTASGTFE